MELVNTFFLCAKFFIISGDTYSCDTGCGLPTLPPHLAYKSNGSTPLHFEVDRLRHLPQFTFFRNFLSGGCFSIPQFKIISLIKFEFFYQLFPTINLKTGYWSICLDLHVYDVLGRWGDETVLGNPCPFS